MFSCVFSMCKILLEISDFNFDNHEECEAV